MQIFVGAIFDEPLSERTSKEYQMSVCSTMTDKHDEYDLDVRLQCWKRI